MNVLSYRGPGKAGGVSGALARIIEKTGDESIYWWYLDETKLKSRNRHGCAEIRGLPDSVVEGHYRHCNNFLWPVLHGMPERALLDPVDKLSYEQFNNLFAINVLRSIDQSLPQRCFVQDYQLSLVPSLLDRSANLTTSIFWHIPWPHSVERYHREALIEVAKGLLASQKIGFHIEEYARNFLNFVRLYLPQFEVDFDTKQVTEIKQKLNRPDKALRSQIVVLPLGLDIQFWSKNSFLNEPLALNGHIRRTCSRPYILSVDRADYTKGVLQRLKAIDHLFEVSPELVGNVSFLQVCQPSRVGLAQFDKYWRQTQKASQELNSRWRQDTWQPLVWVADPVQPSDLAWLYANATAMLVSPLRDGLNLTAKEFISCARREDSVLLLSSGAGVWQELGDLAIQVNAHVPVVAANQIARSLAMPTKEKARRMRELKKRVERNPLDIWWNHFTDELTQVDTIGIPELCSAGHLDFLDHDHDEVRVF